MQLIIGVILGGLVSWFISRWYYKASGKDLEREFAKQAKVINSAGTLIAFERKLLSEKWSKEIIEDEEYWVCESDRTYQMKKGKGVRVKS